MLKLRWQHGLSMVLLCSLSCGEDPKPAPDQAGSGPTTKTAATSAKTSSSTATASATASQTAVASTGSATAEPATSSSASASASAVASAGPKASTTPTAKPSSAPVATTEPKPTAEPTAAPTTDPPLATPASGSADEVAMNIDAIFKDTKRFKARFAQKYKQKITGKEREQQGTVFIERPNKISFHYDPPNKNRTVSDGSTLKLYVAEDQQMFEHPVKETEYPGAFGFIMGSGIRRSFSFGFNEKSNWPSGPVLTGTPLTKNPQYETVLFYVDKAALEKKSPAAVGRVLILDAQGNRNQFTLSEQSFPDSIDPAEFTFTPPEGTNITK